MSEPTRWLDGGAPPGAGALLRAGLAEKPSRRVLQRTLTAVSATAAASTAVGGALGATAQATSSSMLLLVAKGAAIGLVSASVMLGSAVGVQHYRAKAQVRLAASVPARVSPTPVLSRSNTVEPPAPMVSASRMTVDALAPTPLALTAPIRTATTPTATGAIATPIRAVTTGRQPSAASIPSVDSAIPEPSRAEPELVDEIEVIDAARLRLRSGDPAGALQQLNDYDGRSDFRRFAPEALYIRMESQHLLGNRVAAAAAAKEMLFRYPRAAQARRATELLRLLGAQ